MWTQLYGRLLIFVVVKIDDEYIAQFILFK